MKKKKKKKSSEAIYRFHYVAFKVFHFRVINLLILREKNKLSLLGQHILDYNAQRTAGYDAIWQDVNVYGLFREAHNWSCDVHIQVKYKCLLCQRWQELLKRVLFGTRHWLPPPAGWVVILIRCLFSSLPKNELAKYVNLPRYNNLFYSAEWVFLRAKTWLFPGKALA